MIVNQDIDDKVDTPYDYDDDDKELPYITPPSSENLTTIDDILKEAKFGIYQIILMAVLCYLNFSQTYQTLLMYYVGDSPPWKCTTKLDPFCSMYFNKTFDNTDSDFNQRCKLNTSSWQYTQQSKYSIVTEYNLICSREYLQALVNSLFFVGWAFGGVVTGVLADRFGRKIVLIMCYFLLCILPVISSYTLAIWQLSVLRLLLGTVTGTGITVLYVYNSEFQAPKYRSICLNVQSLFFSVSYIVLSVLAMYLPDWRKLTLYSSFPAILSFFIVLLIPESPRWLASKGEKKKAEKVLQKLIKMNGKSFRFTLQCNSSNKESTKYTVLHLFNNCRVLWFVLVQLLAWFTPGLVYYGVSLESSNLGGSIYENLMLSNVADIVAIVINLRLYDWLGRRKTGVFSLFFCGLMLSGIACVPKSAKHQSIIRLVLALFGKLSISIGFGVIYLWSAELFPTVLRTQGMNVCQFASRLGSACSPFLTTVLQDIYRPLPFIVMGVLSIITSLVILLLPETNNRPTREHYKDIFVDKAVVINESINDKEPLCQNDN